MLQVILCLLNKLRAHIIRITKRKISRSDRKDLLGEPRAQNIKFVEKKYEMKKGLMNSDAVRIKNFKKKKDKLSVNSINNY